MQNPLYFNDNAEHQHFMKKSLLALLFAVCLLPIATQGQSVAGTGQLIITASSSGTPVQFTNAPTKVTKVTIIGKKAARTANTGTVYVGPSSANDSQVYEIATGTIHTLSARSGTVIDLSSWWLDVDTNGDGIIILYQ